SIITALFPLGGGIGVLILGALMDKINPNKVVAVGWLLTGVFVCLVGFSTSSLALMGVMVFIAGSSQPTATTLLGLILSIRAPRISTPIPPPSGNRAVII
ncbi:hypothetical protein ACTXQV_58815, partial [Klebsiella pneumoniae]